MRIRLISPEFGPRKGTECDVLAIWVFCDRCPPWYLYVDDGAICISVAMSDVEIIDPSLDGLMMQESGERSGYSLIDEFLVKNPEIFSDLLECDQQAYADLQRHKKLA